MTDESSFHGRSPSAQPMPRIAPTDGTDVNAPGQHITSRRSRARKAARNAIILLAAMLIGALGAFAVSGGTAEAVPTAQSTCAKGVRFLTTADGWQPLPLKVKIDNGSFSRRVIAQLAADMGIDAGAEIRVGYSIDGGPVREKVYGPGNLANHTEFWETRSTIAVMTLRAGVHSVTPYWRISGSLGKNAAFEFGCFTLEGRTS